MPKSVKKKSPKDDKRSLKELPRKRKSPTRETHVQFLKVQGIMSKHARVAQLLLDIGDRQDLWGKRADLDHELVIHDDLTEMIWWNENFEKKKMDRPPDLWVEMIKKHSEQLKQGKDLIETNIISHFNRQCNDVMEVRSLMKEI